MGNTGDNNQGLDGDDRTQVQLARPENVTPPFPKKETIIS